MKKRSRAREVALQYLYQHDLVGESDAAAPSQDDELVDFLRDQDKDSEVVGFARDLAVFRNLAGKQDFENEGGGDQFRQMRLSNEAGCVMSKRQSTRSGRCRTSRRSR